MVCRVGLVWVMLVVLAEVAAAQRPSAADRGTLRTGLPPGALVRLGGPRWLYQEPLNHLAFSPDGVLLAFATVKPADATKPGRKYSIELRDGRRGNLLAELVGHEGAVRAIAFSADSKTIISAGHDKTVRLWNAADGKLLWTAAGCDAAAVGFSTNGKHIIAARTAWKITLLDPTSGDKQREITPENPQSLLDVAPKPALPLPGPESKRTPRAFAPGQFALLPDGKGLVEASGELRLIFRDALSGGVMTSGVAAQPVVAMVGRRAAGKQYVEQCLWPSIDQIGRELTRGLLALVDPASGKVLKTFADFSKPPLDRYHSIAFTADGKRIALCQCLPEARLEVVVRLLDQEKEEARFVLSGGFTPEPKSTPNCLRVLRSAFAAFSPDGARLAVVSPYGLTLCEVATGKQIRPEDEIATSLLDTEHQGFIHAVVFSPDGSRVATAAADREVALWSAKSGRALGRWSHALTFSTEWPVAFSPDGTVMLCASEKEILVVQTADGKTVARLDFAQRRGRGPVAEHRDGVALAFSPDGKRLMAWFVFGNVLLEWETKSWTEQRSTRVEPPRVEMPLGRVGGPQRGYPAVTFSPTLRLVTRGRWEGGMLFTFNASNGEILLKTETAKTATSARFSPDESLLAVAEFNGTIHVVDARQGQTVQTLRAGEDKAFVRAFLDGGRVLASYHGDHATRFWDVRSGREIGRWDGHCLCACSPDERFAATVSTEIEPDDVDRPPDESLFPSAIFLWDLRELAGRLRKARPSQSADKSPLNER